MVEIKSLEIVSDNPLSDFWEGALIAVGVVGILSLLASTFDQ